MSTTRAKIRLFCSNCRANIGDESPCPECGVENEFVGVPPPPNVLAPGSAEEFEPTYLDRGVRPQKASPAQAPGSSASCPLPALSAAGARDSEEDPTAPIPDPVAAEEDKTQALIRESPNPIVALLICREACQDELKFELREGQYTVGRKDARIIVKSEHVSKKHALIKVEKAGPLQYVTTLVDLGSSNKTYVNDVELEAQNPVQLKDSDVIAFADVKLLYRLSSFF